MRKTAILFNPHLLFRSLFYTILPYIKGLFMKVLMMHKNTSQKFALFLVSSTFHCKMTSETTYIVPDKGQSSRSDAGNKIAYNNSEIVAAKKKNDKCKNKTCLKKFFFKGEEK